MAKKTIASKVSDYFASNKGRKEVHATSDGFLFERKQDANSHAKTLKDKNVATFTKSGKVVEKAATSEGAKVEDAKKQSENTAGAKKHPANTGSDQKTAK